MNEIISLSTWVSAGFNLHRPTLHTALHFPLSVSQVYWRKLNLTAKVESSMSHFSFKCLVPGAFNLGLIGSTCTALPR